MILTDTGFWLALFNQRDKHHKKAIAFMSKNTEELITTWPIITETSYLIGRELGIKNQLRFLQLIKSNLINIQKISKSDIHKMETLMLKYADLPMDLADASLVILAEELGQGRILSTDQRDFRTYRWKNHYPFENLLLPD